MGSPEIHEVEAADRGHGRPVCVLGMHRSGTSLTARLLNLLGVDLGPEKGMLRALPHDNPTGFWEQHAIMSLNDELLARFGGYWWRLPELPPDWQDAPELEPLRARARRIIRDRFPTERLWGFKDPRASITLPFWRALAPELRYVICLRHPADVAASLHRRDPKLHDRAASLELWLAYTAGALLETAGRDRILVFYDDLLDDTDAQLDRLGLFLHGRREVPAGIRERAHEFVDRGLAHQRGGADRQAGDELPIEAAVLYHVLREAVPRPRAGGGRREDDGPSSLEALAGDLLRSRRTRRVRESEIERLREEVTRRAEAAERIRRLQGELRSERQRLEEELRSAERRLKEETRKGRRLERRLRAMENSVSWRLTRPLRLIRARRPTGGRR